MSARTTLSPIPALRDITPLPSIQLAPLTDWSTIGKSEHFVQFYEDDCFLIQSVAAFIGAGFSEGEAGIVIATKPHVEALEKRLLQQGLNPDELRAQGDYHPLDASETLAKFMVAGLPDPRLFQQVVGSLVSRITIEGRPLRAFGEMVALLWQEDNAAAAIRLEELWNALGKEHCFSLFCAYPMAGFSGDAHGASFNHICGAHTRVIPAESYTSSSSADERLRTITVLQQKAVSLEGEIQRRRQIEKELASQKRELSDFLQCATEGIHQVAADGKILWANRAELELLGYSPGEYIGQDIRNFHADAPVIADILEKLGRGEALHDYEARLKHKDGSIRHVSINSNVCWDGEKFRYTRCFTRDMTERKRAARILEETVAERTAQLRETVAELEAFSYSISHDMRAPLRAMHGYARALLQDHGAQLSGDAVESLERIQRGAGRLDLLIRDILAYSKVAKGEIELTPIPLTPLLQDVIQQHSYFQQAADLITIESPLPAVLGHEAYLTQCITNLVENALKFVAPGTTPRVRIGSQVIGDRVRLCVSDNGIGIAPEHYDRIYQIFGRVYSEKTYPGTGIGLVVVKKAVARMGGETGFQSEVGKGTTFWVALRHVSV
jgi:PAS domain S-box-containing protein